MISFDTLYLQWSTTGFRPIRELWLSLAEGLNKVIQVKLPGRTVSGMFDTISETGELQLIQSDGKICKIAAGEVFFGQA
jgi:BirA family biotin operon repressor/biotin-[acetyl-CoA-carboxylase] ligase